MTFKIDLIHDTRQLCTRKRSDEIKKKMSLAFPRDKQVIKSVNTGNRVGFVYSRHSYLKEETGYEERQTSMIKTTVLQFMFKAP